MPSYSCGGVPRVAVGWPSMSKSPESELRTWKVRALPVALAHRLVQVQPVDPYMSTLRRLYGALNARERAMCQAEFVRCLN
jgi:hypothetical protein